ncbi:Nudix domain-containing protein [Neofusicoccum parvum]|uniref:Nudix domain-containing protein n=1 Tax=Neofusicoccum parvum TaxID=310453 RepID=A0ACB5SPU9_9PEZI|nr:Nudix domain-containing protein [Neofusicoccum parvum]
MATLTPASAAAIARLRAYKPPPTQYLNLPLARRAAVLILLFADKRGDLRVVLTMRAAGMNTYAGHAALPGGRADALSETPFQTARREAFEEIGLPLSPTALPPPFRIEHLCQLPANLARTELGVRPCVAYLAADRGNNLSPSAAAVTAEDVLIPRLSAQEVAAVFTAPFRGFLSADAETGASAGEEEAGGEAAGFPATWYRGVWTDWHESRWRMHNFYVPVRRGSVARPRGKAGREGEGEPPRKRPRRAAAVAAESAIKGAKGDGDPLADLERFRVFGMTARILVDAARVAYDEEPQFEHNSHFGDEDMIARLLKMGRLSPERKKGDVLTREVLKEAAKL